MAKRFPADPKADRRKAAEEYRDAMREVVKKFPDDLDAATLFAESGMNLHPWGLWHVDGTPEDGTEEDCLYAGVGYYARSQPPGSNSLLHSRGGSIAESGARAGGRQQTGRDSSVRRTHRAHARARLHSHRRLRSRGQRPMRQPRQ